MAGVESTKTQILTTKELTDELKKVDYLRIVLIDERGEEMMRINYFNIGVVSVLDEGYDYSSDETSTFKAILSYTTKQETPMPV